MFESYFIRKEIMKSWLNLQNYNNVISVWNLIPVCVPMGQAAPNPAKMYPRVNFDIFMSVLFTAPWLTAEKALFILLFIRVGQM